MAQQYLLPCECGRTNAVSVAQAGGMIACDCGREHKVPTLAGMRQLELANPAAASKGKASAEWNPVRGALFVLGTMFALAGLALGGYASSWLRIIDLQEVKKFSESAEFVDLQDVDKLTPAAAYDMWKHIQAMGPGTAGSAFTVQAQQLYNYWLRLAIAGFGAAAVGIVMAGGSLLGVRSQR